MHVFLLKLSQFLFGAIKSYLWDAIINGIVMSYLMPVYLRQVVLLALGFKMKGVIHSGCIVQSNKLVIGKRSFINKNCIIDNASAYVRIGSEVAIGYCCSFLTTNHDYNDSKRRGGKIKPKEVIVGDRVWLGANVVLLPGAVVGDGCVVAAGSVVKGILENDTLYSGNPAVPIKRLKV